MPRETNKIADVCLILEGTYPYTMGGVSSWTHELIGMQNHLTFSIIAMVSSDAPAKLLYELPANVINLKTLRLQRLPQISGILPAKDESHLFAKLEKPLLKMQSRATLHDLKEIVDLLNFYKSRLGQRQLLDSRAAWSLMLKMYHASMPKVPFLDYFWSWRGLFGGLFSILLADLPPAKTYHALCTGYAGLMLARAHLETGAPCVLTEHGIYTNERRIEIASADWLNDPNSFNLSVNVLPDKRELKDFWIDTFGNYSKVCYEACSKVITLYQGNQEFQRMDGAALEKLTVIPNGIDVGRFSDVTGKPHLPTVALIGRVVPIKDIKTYIKAVHMLKAELPELRALVLGPLDEDPEYAQECFDLVQHLELERTLIFTGKVNIKDYLGEIDVIVLTSISEAQPLVILEAGAAGIPTVATDVGACREMILGTEVEQPCLGAGGAVVPLAAPHSVANALLKLLNDQQYYQSCSEAIAERVRRYYSKEDQYTSYFELYLSLIGEEANEPLTLWNAAA